MSTIYPFDEVKTLEDMTEIEKDILRRVEILFESDALEDEEEDDLMRVVGKYSIGFCDANSIDVVIGYYEKKLAENGESK